MTAYFLCQFRHFSCCHVKPTALIGRKDHVISSNIGGTQDNRVRYDILRVQYGKLKVNYEISRAQSDNNAGALRKNAGESDHQDLVPHA